MLWVCNRYHCFTVSTLFILVFDIHNSVCLCVCPRYQCFTVSTLFILVFDVHNCVCVVCMCCVYVSATNDKPSGVHPLFMFYSYKSLVIQGSILYTLSDCYKYIRWYICRSVFIYMYVSNNLPIILTNPHIGLTLDLWNNHYPQTLISYSKQVFIQNYVYVPILSKFYKLKFEHRFFSL